MQDSTYRSMESVHTSVTGLTKYSFIQPTCVINSGLVTHQENIEHDQN